MVRRRLRQLRRRQDAQARCDRDYSEQDQVPKVRAVGETSASKHKNEFKKTTARQRYDRAIARLLDHVCIKMGFCGSAGIERFDTKRGVWTAESFALEVLRAEGVLMVEGVGPEQSPYFKMLRDRFVKQFGASVCVQDFEGEA